MRLRELARSIVQAWTEPLATGVDGAIEASRARVFRARQLQAVLRVTPLVMAANAVNVAIVCLAFWSTAPAPFLVTWVVCLGLLIWRGSAAWMRSRARPRPNGVSRRAVTRAELHATLLAACWGAAPLVLFADADPARQILLATLVTGMIGAGGFALASIPTAGTLYVVVLGASSAIGLARSNVSTAPYIAVLFVMYGLTVIGSVWFTARTFGARLLAEAEAAQQHEVIGLLLKDFEESASDVLWEIDSDGRLIAPSARLADLVGLPRELLISAPMIDLLKLIATPGTEAHGLVQALHTHFERQHPFRDVVVSGIRTDKPCWWSFSAKPRLGAGGERLGWRGVVGDVTERHLAHQRLTWLAHNDSLTGLGNRHQFRTRVEQLLAMTAESDECLAVIYIDLDHFKALNDTLGHLTGDAVLKLVGERMLAITRRTDMVARLGGDEFAVLLSSISKSDEVDQFSRRLLTVIDQPCDVAGATYRIRGSLGVAVAPRDGRDVDTLLSHADLALYAAKTAGRNRVRFYADDMGAQTRRRLAIEERLREAVNHGEFHVVFQPKIAMREPRVLGFEALLRWQPLGLDGVAPTEFIPVAEASGQMLPISNWVLESALHEAATWRPDLTIAVNMSPAHVASPDFVAHVLGALREANLPANRLELEITESALLHDTDATVQALRELRKAGCQIVLDDFGTGYSALSYLRQFPFHEVKIDQSLIVGLETRTDAQAIVRMIVGMARALALRTVAEGVEDLAQLGPLSRFGCDAAQGYALGRPMPAQAVPAYLERPMRWSANSAHRN